jgi:hypothetical protein
MTTLHFDGVSGRLTTALAPGDTTMASAGLQDLGVVSGGNLVQVALFSQDATTGRLTIEIVHVIAHSSGASTATVLRGQNGTTARSWTVGATWTHGITVQDYLDLVALVTAEAGARAAGDSGLATALGSAVGTLTSALTAESALARNADNLTSGTVADARVASTIARDSDVATAIAGLSGTYVEVPAGTPTVGQTLVVSSVSPLVLSWGEAVGVTVGLLTESGDFLITESGDTLVLEAA